MPTLILLAALAVGAFLYFRKKGTEKNVPLPDWMRGFIVFYAADRASMVAGSGEAHREISRIIRQGFSFSDQQSMMVLLRGYISEVSPDNGDFQRDLNTIMRAMPDVLRFELAGHDTPAAIQNMLVTENPEMQTKPSSEVNETAQKIHQSIRDKDPEAVQFEDRLTCFRLDRVFEKLHGRPRAVFSQQLMDSLEGA